MGLLDKLVIVSGAANGIGAAVCLSLAKQAANVIGIDLEPFKDSELQEKLLSSGLDPSLCTNLKFVQGDCSNEEQMEEALEFVGDVYGLVNNAGLLGTDASHGGRSPESMTKMLDSHLQSALVLTEVCWPKMNQGSIVNIGSIESLMSAPDVVLYTSAKSALHGMTVAYANELAPNIRVNMVSPGNVNTPRNLAQYTKPGPKKILERFENRTPLKRSAEPSDVANAVLFLLSEQSSYITGENLIIDGGYTRALWDPGWA